MTRLGLHSALAGIYVLRGVDARSLDRIVMAAVDGYDGPDTGGLDVLAPNPRGEAWVLLGRWTDCFAAEIQEGASLLLLRFRAAIAAAGGRATIVPWLVVHGALLDNIDPGRWQRWLADAFPRAPAWVGIHMGAPHWLGVGVSMTEGRIEAVTPYARLDLRADGVVMFTGVAEDAQLRGWIPQLRAALEGS